MLAFLHASTAFFALFFYPIHHIGLVHLQYFPYASSADSSVVHFDRQLPRLFRVFVPFRVYGVIDAALLTFAALASRTVIPRLDLVLCLSAFWASFPCLFCALSHIFYYTIKSLFWTLPGKTGHSSRASPSPASIRGTDRASRAQAAAPPGAIQPVKGSSPEHRASPRPAHRRSRRSHTVKTPFGPRSGRRSGRRTPGTPVPPGGAGRLPRGRSSPASGSEIPG